MSLQIRTAKALTAALSVLLLVAEPHTVHGAGEFSPPGLYNPEVYRLENGLQVVLRPRVGSRSVAIRAVVELGTAHFPCPKQETPHFLEHLLFTGTTQHSEEELELLISSHGGSWNAATGDRQTVYEIDIFSGHAALGIETLHEILTDTEIADAKVELSREVLQLEAGGAPSAVAILLDRSGIFHSAATRAFNRLMSPYASVCTPPALASDVSSTEIKAAYRSYYVPANMSLVVVGDFDVDAMRATIQGTFGGMPAAPFVAAPRGQIPPHPGAIALTGFGGQASVGFVFRTGGYLSEDHAALWVLESYLRQRLYQVLRVERGLTYTPSISYSPSTEVGLFSISAEVEGENAIETLGLIDAEIDRIRKRDVDLDALEKAREGLLLSYSQGFESNADVADYYVESLFELASHGAFVDEEGMLKSLSLDAILGVGASAFAADKAISIRDRRVYFEEIMTGSAVVAVFVVGYVPWRLIRQGKSARRRRKIP